MDRPDRESLKTEWMSFLATGVIAFVIAIAVSGCATAQLDNMWRDETFVTPMDKVFVVALKEEASRRRLWEDEIVHEMAKHRVTGVPSYSLYPDAVPDTQAVEMAVREQGFDGVMVIFDLDPRQEEVYVPGYLATEPVYRVDPWSRRWLTYYVQVEHPGYYATDTVIRDQVDLYSTGDRGRLVWSGVGEVVNAGDAHQIREEVCDRIVPELAKQGIIGSGMD
ncbi:MAG TPA: hypothetical protein VF720_02390 [Candidatus Eisenbacteria bacterium]